MNRLRGGLEVLEAVTKFQVKKVTFEQGTEGGKKVSHASRMKIQKKKKENNQCNLLRGWLAWST